jgi:predicted secreted protein
MFTGVRLAACISIFLLVTGCTGASGSSTSDCRGTSTSATKPVLTEIDSGRCLKLVVGQTAELRLAGNYSWSMPEPSGDAVELIPLTFFRDPGYAAWEVRAVRSGTSAISASGSCLATDCAKPTSAFSVTIAVSS